MTIVPALDLRDQPSDAAAGPLHNLEAEQALLGALICDNACFEYIDDSLSADHFAEPLHGRLFDEIAKLVRAGKLAEPILLESRFRNDPAFADLGGLQYLAQLVRDAPPGPNAPDYAEEVLEMALRRRMETIAAAAQRRARDFSLSARRALEETEGELFSVGETTGRKQGFVSFGEALRGAVNMAAEAYERDGSLAGLSTGLLDLDQRTGGLHPSDLLILAARPSMGKTSLACNIAFDVAKRYQWTALPDGSRKTTAGGVVAFFSLEMSSEQLAMRILAEASGVSGDKMRRGEIDASDFGRIRDAAMLIEESPLFIDATGGLSIDRLCQRARRLKRTVGLDLVVVDYLQLVTVMGAKVDNRVQVVATITQALKALAKELNVPVLALSQLSRQVELRTDKKPQLADLRESGSIEQDADMVMFVYRESYYLEREEPSAGTPEHFDWQTRMSEARGIAELIIGKQRHGPIGTVRLAFNESLTKFGNLARGNADIRQTGIDFSAGRGEQ